MQIPAEAALRRAGSSLAEHPRLAAPLLGAIAACGFQPLALWPLTLLGIAGLIHLVSKARSAGQAALIGWLFGVGHFTIGNTWIATAFTYQANMPAWLGWVAVVLLSFYLAVFPALGMLGAWLLGRRGEVSLALSFAACWIVSEWLRSWVFTGFAWNPLGIAALGSFTRPGLAALAPWLGTYALSGGVALLAAAWLAAIHRRRLDWQTGALALLPIAAFLLPIHGANETGKLAFTLVQPDVRQQELDDPTKWESQFASIAGLTRPATPGSQRLVLWPESAIPDYLRDGYPAYLYRQTTYAADPSRARQRIGAVIGPGSLLLAGAVDLEVRKDTAVAARNVITAVDAGGALHGSYAKAHLVPYGEYLPLRWLLEPLGASRLVAGALDFEPGPGPRTLNLGPWGKAGAQLCYEIIFSGQVVDRADRPDFIFNPSNDGWFGSWGPPQHLAQARLRAIEEGLPVLRSTTTGISAVIDADGVVRQFIPRHRAARLDGFVPPAHAATLFARLGNLLPLLWAALLIALSLVARRVPVATSDRPS
jgi:apolipoprotein N-acyltransferase